MEERYLCKKIFVTDLNVELEGEQVDTELFHAVCFLMPCPVCCSLQIFQVLLLFKSNRAG